MDWWYEFASCETKKHAWRKVVLADAVTELEILVEHGAEGEGDRLGDIRLRGRHDAAEWTHTLRYMYEVGGGICTSGERLASSWVSRSSKRMPPAGFLALVKRRKR